jgi:hypothetical protein
MRNKASGRKNLLFLKKKKQKNFFPYETRRSIEPAAKVQSFFASFLRGHLAVACSKKEDSSFLPLACPSA